MALQLPREAHANPILTFPPLEACVGVGRREYYLGEVIVCWRTTWARLHALTAHTMAKDRKKCIDAGCEDYTTKQIEREKIVTIVSQYASRDTTKNWRKTKVRRSLSGHGKPSIDRRQIG